MVQSLISFRAALACWYSESIVFASSASPGAVMHGERTAAPEDALPALKERSGIECFKPIHLMKLEDIILISPAPPLGILIGSEILV